MNALLENFKFINSYNTPESYVKPKSKEIISNSTQNNNQNLKERNSKEIYACLNSNENIIKIVQLLNELNFKYFKERQLTKVMVMSAANSKLDKNMVNSHEYENNENKSKYAVDSFSEVKKFKTELCHSWELTGTCKYGLNVIYFFIIYNIYFIIVCFCSWSK